MKNEGNNSKEEVNILKNSEISVKFIAFSNFYLLKSNRRKSPGRWRKVIEINYERVN